MSVEDLAARVREMNAGRRRGTAAETAAANLRDLIMAGDFQPGQRIAEEPLLEPMEVSRNTLREAFRLLAHEKLLEHRINHGVFVRTLTADDVRDLFRVRFVIEVAALRGSTEPDWAAMADAVADGRARAANGDWRGVGTANLRFHKAIVRAVGSGRLDELMDQLSAELRLGFLAMGHPRAFHEKYVDRNHAIVKAISGGDVKGAVALLTTYLADAQREMLAAFERRAG
ncbi:GntR family transcriptional regulator [Actinokineospora inagensis]|uniref:GntR family transcriptional regulator n=1 Tax=Actinokineospora inagensis TaxID=103730 RepID=UPI0004287F2D|nr:GntR family transcriptional regulator [Actinokineospora inagensis]